MQKSIYKKARRDKRVREYLPATRVVWSQKLENPNFFCGNEEIQPVFDGEFNAIKFEKGSSVLIDFGIELHGGVRIVNAGGRGRVRLRFGESVSEAIGNPNQDHTIHDTELDVPNAGLLEYGTTAFRFVRIDALDGEMKFINVIAVASYRDLPWVGNFHCSDERLNRIWHTGAYTVLLNMQDYLYDGPKRDRIIWMGDMHPEIRCILAVFQDTSIVRSSLDFLIKHYPLPLSMNHVSTYSLWYIISLADYYERTGDIDFLNSHCEYIRGLLEICFGYVSPDGRENIPGRRFLDWPNNNNPMALHAGLQGLLYWTFRKAEYLSGALALPTAGVKKALQLLSSYTPDPGLNKSAAAIMTVSGLHDRSDIVERYPFSGVSTFFGYYMLQAKSTASALELIRRYWGGMLDYGATTFWEDFNLDWLENSTSIAELPVPGKSDLHADFGDHCYKGLRHSLCHGWAGGPTPFLSERISGIKFLKPGGKEISFSPDLGGLEYAKCTIPTMYGAVKIVLEAGKKMKVDVPGQIMVKVMNESM